MKRLFSVIALSAILLFSSCSEAERFENNSDTQQSSSKMVGNSLSMEADGSYQWEANEKLVKLLESFGTTINRFNQLLPNYPEYYGGAYISEKGNLVIYIHGDQEKGMRAVIATIGSGNIEFKKAEYSYSNLTAIMDDLNELALRRKDPAILESLTSFSLLDKSNEVEVQLIGLNDQKMEMLNKAVSNRPGITFKESTGRVKAEITMNPGCEVSRNASMAGSGSIGFRAKRNSDGKLGFVTAGHAILVGETAYYSGGTAVGTCVNSQQSGTVDAAFVTINTPASDDASNTLCGTSNLLSVSTTLPGVGTTVNKIGQSTGATSGTIISTNVSVIGSTGSTITNMTSANYTSAGGDSGGPVYTYISSSGTRPTAGIHMGASGSTRYFTKASNILSTFGLSRH